MNYNFGAEADLSKDYPPENNKLAQTVQLSFIAFIEINSR